MSLVDAHKADTLGHNWNAFLTAARNQYFIQKNYSLAFSMLLPA